MAIPAISFVRIGAYRIAQPEFCSLSNEETIGRRSKFGTSAHEEESTGDQLTTPGSHPSHVLACDDQIKLREKFQMSDLHAKTSIGPSDDDA